MVETTNLTTTRWRKHGKDRLYVSDTQGARVGWVDLLTGERHLENLALAAEFETAITTFQDAKPGTAEPKLTSPRGQGSATSVRDVNTANPAGKSPYEAVAGWEDLTLRRPGQAARERAIEELDAARRRSRFWTFVARLMDAKTDERAWRIGADGEETVGRRLEQLREHGWHVLHAVPVGDRGSDIDHVLVGPGGVYTINTKNHPGGKVWVGKNAIRVNGHAVPYLRNSRHEAARASRLLSSTLGFNVPVTPVLVFLTGTRIPNVTIKTKPDDVLIMDRIDVPRAFKKAAVTMDPRVVDLVHDLARRSTTWSSPGN